MENAEQTIGVATAIAAWVGALGSLGLTILEIVKHLKDKVRIEIKYSFNLELISSTVEGKFVKLSPNKTFWSVTVDNVGDKDFIFNQLCFSHTNTDRRTMLTKDYNGKIGKFTLLSRDSYSFTIPNDLINPAYVKEIIVGDATGRSYKQRVIYKL